jgi:hypothetical protein
MNRAMKPARQTRRHADLQEPLGPVFDDQVPNEDQLIHGHRAVSGFPMDRKIACISSSVIHPLIRPATASRSRKIPLRSARQSGRAIPKAAIVAPHSIREFRGARCRRWKGGCWNVLHGTSQPGLRENLPREIRPRAIGRAGKMVCPGLAGFILKLLCDAQDTPPQSRAQRLAPRSGRPRSSICHALRPGGAWSSRSYARGPTRPKRSAKWHGLRRRRARIASSPASLLRP